STLGTEHVSTTLFCSPDEKWINVKWTFKSPMLSKQKVLNDYFTYTLAKVNSSHVLRERPILRKHVTYLSEHANYPKLSKEWDLAVSKDLNFVFRKDVLVRNHAEIAGEVAE